MEFNIGDLVVLRGNFTHPHKITNKGNFYSEISSSHSIILYQISKHENEWFNEEELQLWNNKEEISEFTKQLQKECFLCQKYGNQRVINSKYCTGFFNSECEKCAVFIGNRSHTREEYIYEFPYD